MIRLKLVLALLIVLIIIVPSFKALAGKPSKDPSYYELKVYYFGDKEQEAILDNYLQSSFMPSLRANGINNIGVFKAIANDTAPVKKMYVFIPFKSLKQWQKYLSGLTNKEANTVNEYIDARFDKPAYSRIETIFMSAFKFMPTSAVPKLSGPKSERVYELRSYESASEKLFKNKVHMFNEGGEINIFSRLGFNAVFYGEVLYGGRTPNLMYMTTFENKKARDEHWKAFSADPEWKTLSGKKEYQKNVSRQEMNFLRPTDYSDF